MRLLDEDTDTSTNRVTLFLTFDEARQLRDYLTALLEMPPGRHVHISSEDYQKEITVCTYEADSVDGYDFSQRTKKIILNDE